MAFRNEFLDLGKLSHLVKECYDLHGAETTALLVNSIKRLGFHYATVAGVTVAAMDIKTPPAKAGIIAKAEDEVEQVDLQFRRGLITDDERYLKTVDIWTNATDKVTEVTMSSFDRFHSVLMMSQSGARGSKQQIRQLAGMRGLMADPTGPDHRPADQGKLLRGPHRSRVLHLHPRRAQGTRGHGPAYR